MNMLEPLVRSNISRWQSVYDVFPSPARSLLASARGWLLTQVRYAPQTFAYLEQLRAHENWSADEIAAHQSQALRGIFEHARRTVPYYRDYPNLAIRDPQDFRRLPVLARETVRQNHEQLLSTETPPRHRIRAGTTGTTGGNLKVAFTEELARANWACLLRQWAWAGVEALQPRVTLFGARVVPVRRAEPPFWIHNLPERQILLSIFHLSEKTAPDYRALLRKQSGKILEGFPSVLGILADFVLESGAPIPMRVVFTSGEPLYPATRIKLEVAFQCQVFDSYGMTEYCGLIHQCAHGQMHLIPEFGYLEILDENERPVAEGEEGYFVWTGFLNRAMPLIRYRIGDRGRWQHGSACTCGLKFPLVIPTITRESEILRCADGRLFSPRALNQLLKEATSLRFCQFIHDRPERVIVRAVSGNGHASEEMMLIRTRLQSLLGPAIRVTAEIATAPVVLPGGKIPLIIDHATRSSEPSGRATSHQEIVMNPSHAHDAHQVRP
jgi:phenylacetate-coenzyme A ligase PaaK-like adenylate-forming protein